jgi:acyl carrier protein
MNQPESVSGGRSIDRAAVESEIRRILVAELGVAADLLDGAATTTPLLGQGLGLDSMEALVLISGLERAFGFEAPDDELTAEVFATVDSLAERVALWVARSRQGEGPPEAAR